MCFLPLIRPQLPIRKSDSMGRKELKSKNLIPTPYTPAHPSSQRGTLRFLLNSIAHKSVRVFMNLPMNKV